MDERQEDELVEALRRIVRARRLEEGRVAFRVAELAAAGGTRPEVALAVAVADLVEEQAASRRRARLIN